VITPQVFAKELWEISGHWQNYKEAHARTRQHASARPHAKRTTPLHTRTHARDARTHAHGSEADPRVAIATTARMPPRAAAQHAAARRLSQDMFLLEGIEAAEGKEGEQHGEPPHAHAHVARPPPHLHRDWARRCHICTGTGLAAATSALGLGSLLPHLRRDRARRCHIWAGTGLAAATSGPGPGATVRCGASARQHLAPQG
jgi:hypothetical protein